MAALDADGVIHLFTAIKFPSTEKVQVEKVKSGSENISGKEKNEKEEKIDMEECMSFPLEHNSTVVDFVMDATDCKSSFSF